MGQVKLTNVQNGVQAACKNDIDTDQTEYVKNIRLSGNERDSE
jgi:hypothetical protein